MQPIHASACDITHGLISKLYLHITLLIALLQRVNALYKHIHISNKVEIHPPMWRPTLFDICMCLYNAFTRCNNAIDRTMWRYNLEMRPRVISQAITCNVYDYTQLFTTIIPIHPPVNQFPPNELPCLPH